MSTIKRKAQGTSHNPMLAAVLDEAKKESVNPRNYSIYKSGIPKFKT